ncbi:class I SAM-dependent methyltransferase [Methanosarcina barkeri]|uniref:SAM-dependent methyltransferase n=1 Tax=Methanosarcina barkeri CM1 TaxID=796385 RepID=A0A0G3CDU7_METBA|nr:class I SAM-dependent methyltransferase [Methanosarcina barkeri]AKJ40174.1 SAM-dependent methyltransferase [Methanosarcina barkeri CM1]
MLGTVFEQIEKAWSADSGGYDQVIQKQLSNEEDVKHWQDELRLVLGEKPLHVLDVGCGPGFFTIMLARLKHNVTSVDGAEGMVEHARINIKKEALNAKIYKSDAVLLDNEKEGSLDAIVSRDVVWTLYDPEKAFIRWKYLLKADGKIVIYDGDYRRDQSSLRYHVLKLTSDLINLFMEGKHRKKKQHNSPGNGFEQLPMIQHKRPQYDRELLLKAGFSKVEVTKDCFRNSPLHLEFWRYGYQGKKFRIIAYK